MCPDSVPTRISRPSRLQLITRPPSVVIGQVWRRRETSSRRLQDARLLGGEGHKIVLGRKRRASTTRGPAKRVSVRDANDHDDRYAPFHRPRRRAGTCRRGTSRRGARAILGVRSRPRRPVPRSLMNTSSNCRAADTHTPGVCRRRTRPGTPANPRVVVSGTSCPSQDPTATDPACRRADRESAASVRAVPG